MASDRPVASSGGADEADLAKAFQELARGERTATALENQLSVMEAKIEALLAQAEKDEQEARKMKAQKAESSADTKSSQKASEHGDGA